MTSRYIRHVPKRKPYKVCLMAVLAWRIRTPPDGYQHQAWKLRPAAPDGRLLSSSGGAAIYGAHAGKESGWILFGVSRVIGAMRDKAILAWSLRSSGDIHFYLRLQLVNQVGGGTDGAGSLRRETSSNRD